MADPRRRRERVPSVRLVLVLLTAALAVLLALVDLPRRMTARRIPAGSPSAVTS
ncbi:MAG TPA: hypothetical protein VJT31_35055 [Rugosimonospora sp.]|nr:hypothetical protein [Rugosimonospora sp.]